MLNISKLALLLAGAGACLAAPVNNSTSSSNPSVTVKNSCSDSLKVYMMANGGSIIGEDVSAGSSHTFDLDSNWAGRFWGCPGGDSSCSSYGSAVSLAEIAFAQHQGQDFYDISFVDGFNLPISISPDGKSGSDKDCGEAACSKLPTCPDGLEGENGACKSACSAFGTDEYCCTGEHNSGDKCPSNEFADKVKPACPNVYTYAFDDATSVYACQSNSYTVTLCP
ncbi:thaumatin [Dichotomocladium elegans]|nr:thaumatin [Dichotomocladium elegans]